MRQNLNFTFQKAYCPYRRVQKTCVLLKVHNVKVNQSHYRPAVVQSAPGS